MTKSRGFTLIELMIVMTIGSIMLTMVFTGVKYGVRTYSLWAVGQDAEKLRLSVEGYVARNYDILIDAIPAPEVCVAVNRPGSPDPAWRRNVIRLGKDWVDDNTGDPTSTTDAAILAKCGEYKRTKIENTYVDTCTDKQCAELELSEFINTGFAPLGSIGQTSGGTGYRVYLRRVGTGKGYNIEFFIATRDPVQYAGDASEDDFISSATIAKLALGSEGGVVVRATDASGSFFLDAASEGKLMATAGKQWALSPNYFESWHFKDNPIKTPGQLVMRGSFLASQFSAYVNSGDPRLNNNLNAQGHTIGGLGKKQVGAPCDGKNGRSAESAALVGHIAEYAPPAWATASYSGATQQLGAGYQVKCVYDDDRGENVWHAVVNPSTQAAQAGLMEGWETDAEYMCLALDPLRQASGAFGMPASVWGGVQRTKFVIKGGDAWIYVMTPTFDGSGKQIWVWALAAPLIGNSPYAPYALGANGAIGRSGGFNLSYDWASWAAAGNVFGIPFQSAAIATSEHVGCIETYVAATQSGARGAKFLTKWEMSGTAISDGANGTVVVQSSQGMDTLGLEDLSGIPVSVDVQVEVPSCNAGTCTTSTQTVTGTGYTNGRAMPITMLKDVRRRVWTFRGTGQCRKQSSWVDGQSTPPNVFPY